jgi:hypothetical protein
MKITLENTITPLNIDINNKYNLIQDYIEGQYEYFVTEYADDILGRNLNHNERVKVDELVSDIRVTSRMYTQLCNNIATNATLWINDSLTTLEPRLKDVIKSSQIVKTYIDVTQNYQTMFLNVKTPLTCDIEFTVTMGALNDLVKELEVDNISLTDYLYDNHNVYDVNDIATYKLQEYKLDYILNMLIKGNVLSDYTEYQQQGLFYDYDCLIDFDTIHDYIHGLKESVVA